MTIVAASPREAVHVADAERLRARGTRQRVVAHRVVADLDLDVRADARRAEAMAAAEHMPGHTHIHIANA